MNIWIIQDGEPLPCIDEGTRDWRCGILSKVLAGRGHDILWWASTFDHFQKKHRFQKPCTVEIMPRVKVRLLHGPGYKSNKSPMRFLHQKRIAQAFSKEASDFLAPDIIISGLPLLELSEQALIWGRKHQVPVVIDVRDAWPDIYLTMFPNFLQGLVRVALSAEFRRIERIFRSASGIVAVSNTYLDWALRYADRAARSSDCVFALGHEALRKDFNEHDNEHDIADFIAKYDIQSKKMIVTFIGMFGFSYDLQTVVKAAKILSSQKEDDIQFILAGDGDAGPSIREMAANVSNLILTGWIDQKSIKILLNLSSVGLSAYAGKATQTLPNKPFEYMAAGLPLLSSLQGEMELLIHNKQIGLQYQAGDVDSLVAGIRWLAKNQVERQAMGQRALCLFQERFDASVIYPQLAEYLEWMGENGKNPS